MNNKKIEKGLEILLKYDPDYQVYISPTSITMDVHKEAAHSNISEEDAESMKKNGWFYTTWSWYYPLKKRKKVSR